MQLGASLPVGDIGTGPAVLRDYAQAAEGLGYQYMLGPDHVLGANPNVDYGSRRVGTSATAYHDPFVVFAFLEIVRPEFYGGVMHERAVQMGLIGLGTWMAIGNLVMRRMIDLRI